MGLSVKNKERLASKECKNRNAKSMKASTEKEKKSFSRFVNICIILGNKVKAKRNKNKHIKINT